MFSNRSFVCLVALSVIGMSFTGCRNRCQQQCGNPFQQQLFQQQQFPQQFQQQQFPNQFGFNGAANLGQPNAAGRSPVIPAPATGSLNIPSLARNNPFGVNGGLLNTGQRAPTPAGSGQFNQFNRQNGWQPVGNGTGSTTQGSPQTNNTQQNSGTTLGSSSRTAAPIVPTAAQSVLTQNGQSQPAGYGDSFVRSPDYSTTAVNETNDRTRLPATDASGVRAPSQYYARASGVQVANLPSRGNFSVPQQPYYSGTFGGNNPAAINVAAGTLQSGRTVGATGVFAANSGAFVQGQSTATYDPYGDTRSADWRNRDISSGTFQ